MSTALAPDVRFGDVQQAGNVGVPRKIARTIRVETGWAKQRRAFGSPPSPRDRTGSRRHSRWNFATKIAEWRQDAGNFGWSAL